MPKNVIKIEDAEPSRFDSDDIARALFLVLVFSLFSVAVGYAVGQRDANEAFTEVLCCGQNDCTDVSINFSTFECVYGRESFVLAPKVVRKQIEVYE